MIKGDYLPRLNRIEKMKIRAVIRAVIVVSILILITSIIASA